MTDPSTGAGQAKPPCPFCGEMMERRHYEGPDPLGVVDSVNWHWRECIACCARTGRHWASEAEAGAAARRRAPVLTKEEADAISTCITGYSALLSDMLRITGSTVCLEGPVKAELERLAAKIRELSEGVE